MTRVTLFLGTLCIVLGITVYIWPAVNAPVAVSQSEAATIVGGKCYNIASQGQGCGGNGCPVQGFLYTLQTTGNSNYIQATTFCNNDTSGSCGQYHVLGNCG